MSEIKVKFEGKPGSGKSRLMRVLINHLEKNYACEIEEGAHTFTVKGFIEGLDVRLPK